SHRRLSRGVDAVFRQSFAANHRRIENDGCAVGQQRQCLLNRKNYAFYVGIENRIEELPRDGAQRGIAGDTGICKHDVEFALLPLDLVKEAIEVVEVLYVSLHAGDISSDLLRGDVQLRLPASCDENVGAFADKLLRCRKADAAIAARNESDFSAKLAHIFLLP